MENEPARRNGINVIKEIVMVRMQTASSGPPIDAPALIKALVATFESTRAKTWIIQQNITDPKAIKSEKTIPIGDKLKEYYSATDLMTRGTPTGIKYHLTFVTEQDIESIKQIPEILEYIKANKLSVSEDVFDGEKAIPIGCLLNIHPNALKTNIHDLERDLSYTLNRDRMNDDAPELVVKLNPRQLLSRRLSLPPTLDSSVIEILATEHDKDEILGLIPNICYGHYHFGSFFNYGKLDWNPVEALQEHNTYLKNHRVVALRAKREILTMDTSRGFSMESEILKVKNHQGEQMFQRIDYNRKSDVVRLHFTANNEQEAFKYADTTFKAEYNETARYNQAAYEPVQNVFPKYLHYDYVIDPSRRMPPANAMPPRRNGRKQRPPSVISTRHQAGSPIARQPPTPGFNTPPHGNGPPRPNPWFNARKPWNEEGSAATLATTTTDKDEIKMIVEESIKDLMEQREKVWETEKLEIKKAQEASKQDQEAIRAEIQSLKEANESMKAANDTTKASNEALNASMNARFDSLEAVLMKYFQGSQANPPPAPTPAPTEPHPEAIHATQGTTTNDTTAMETEEPPPPTDVDLKPAAEPNDAEEMIDADESPIGSTHPVPPLKPNDDSTEQPTVPPTVDPSDAPPLQEPTTEPTPTPTSDIPPEPTPASTKDAPASEATETTPSKRPFSLGKVVKFQLPNDKPHSRLFRRPPVRPATRATARIATSNFDEIIEKHNAHNSPAVRLERIRRLNDNKSPDPRFEDHQDPARRKKGDHSVSPMKTSQLFDSDDEDDDENEKDKNEGGAGANNNNDTSPGAS